MERGHAFLFKTLGLLALLSAWGSQAQAVTTVTDTPTLTATPPFIPSSTYSYTISPTPTRTQTFVPSVTLTGTSTATRTATRSITPSPSISATYTVTVTQSVSPTISNSRTATQTASPFPTATATPIGLYDTYDFETGQQGWVVDPANPGGVSLGLNSINPAGGIYCLALNLNLTAANPVGGAYVDTSTLPNDGCRTLGAWMYVPAGLGGAVAEIYAWYGPSWTWVNNSTVLPSTAGWIYLTPLDLTGIFGTIQRIGVQVNLGGPPPAADFGGTVLLDNIQFQINPVCLTPSPTPTVTPEPTQAYPGVSSPLIEDFVVDLGSSQSGQSRSFISKATQACISSVPGCPCGSKDHALRLSGTAITGGGLVSAYNDNAVYFDKAGDYSYPSTSRRTFSLKVRASALPTGRIAVMMGADSNATAWGVFVPVTIGAWVNVTIALPNHQNPGSWPQLALFNNVSTWSAAAARLVRFAVAAEGGGSSAPYDLEIDDVSFGTYANNSSCQKAAAFGVSADFATEAESLGLDEQGGWVVLTLSKHCGLSPTQILTRRAYQTWGQIAASCGTNWAQVLDEANTAAENAGLEAELGTPDQWLRMMTNGAPSLAPLPTPLPYLPAGPVYVPPASGTCP